MKRLNEYFCWVTALALVVSTSGLDGFGSNKTAPVAVTQAQPTSAQGQGQAEAPATRQQGVTYQPKNTDACV